MLIPINCFELSKELVSQPIPTALNKQFIAVKTTAATASQEELARKLFWFKDYLLQRISAKWLCVRCHLIPFHPHLSLLDFF